MYQTHVLYQKTNSISTRLLTCDSDGHGDEEHVEPTVRQEEP